MLNYDEENLQKFLEIRPSFDSKKKKKRRNSLNILQVFRRKKYTSLTQNFCFTINLKFPDFPFKTKNARHKKTTKLEK